MIPAVREWLRNERRLGAAHVAASRVGVAGDSARAQAPSPDRERARGCATGGSPASANTGSKPPVARAGSQRPRGPEEAEAAAALAALDEQQVKNCTKCVLHEQRTKTVFGAGSVRPDIVFVGEGPGADEDRQGVPFVGRAGQLLTRMIAAMGLTRDQVYIANVVKCRPPGNRTPTDAEAAACCPYLYRQLAILRPKLIVALGRPASQLLLQTTKPIGKLRGEFHDFPPPGLAHLDLSPIKLMPTFHPAYLLRSPGEKTKAWEDLKQVMMFLNIPIPARYA